MVCGCAPALRGQIAATDNDTLVAKFDRLKLVYPKTQKGLMCNLVVSHQ